MRRELVERARNGDRWVVLGALLVVAMLGALAGAGALLIRETTVPPTGVVNGWVAFTVEGWTRQSESDIFLVRDGAEEHRVTGSDRDTRREACPRFSRDGTRLVYTEGPADAADDGGVAVVIVTLDPSGLRVGPEMRLPVVSWGGVCPRWSPDSRSVAFLAFEPTSPEPVLWTWDVDGTARRIGAWGETSTVVHIDWSPDGTAIAATEITGSRIWIVPIGGTEARLFQRAGAGVEFTSGPAYEGARWSPDGMRIGVVAHQSTGSFIRIYQVDDGEPPIELEGGSAFAWSPDGQVIAYVRPGTQDGSEVSEVVMATATGDALRVIARDRRSIRGLTWSPDSTLVLYAADGPGALVAASAAGDAPPVVLTHESHNFYLTSSDDISWQEVRP